MSVVSFVKTKQSVQHMKQALLDSLSLIDYTFPKNIENVVIKPNMCYYWDYSTGHTTDPNFVASVIEMIREEINPEVKFTIVESDASAMECKYAFPILGYDKIAKQENVNLVNLSQEKGSLTEITVGDEHFEFIVPEVITEAHLKINIPKLKYLSNTKITCALKNIFGCNPNKNKYKYHSILNETIVALNKILNFDLCILDGIMVVGSHTRKLNLIMASLDAVAFDAAAAKIAGIDPRKVKHIVLANEEGLGNIRYSVKGDDLEQFIMNFPTRKLKDNILSFGYKMAKKTGLLNS